MGWGGCHVQKDSSAVCLAVVYKEQIMPDTYTVPLAGWRRTVGKAEQPRDTLCLGGQWHVWSSSKNFTCKFIQIHEDSTLKFSWTLKKKIQNGKNGGLWRELVRGQRGSKEPMLLTHRIQFQAKKVKERKWEKRGWLWDSQHCTCPRGLLCRMGMLLDRFLELLPGKEKECSWATQQIGSGAQTVITVSNFI